MRYFGVVACVVVWGVASVVAAQEPGQPAWQMPEPAAKPEATEPEAPPSAPRPANPWEAVRAERDQARLVLSDAWMEYLATDELKTLRLNRWLGAVTLGLAAATWGFVAVENQTDHGAIGDTLALSGAAALSLGLTAAMLFTSDPYLARSTFAWAYIAESSVFATTLGTLAIRGDCRRDCRRFLAAGAASAIAQALQYIVIEVFLPPVFVSQQYDEYQRLEPAQRSRVAMDLLRARDQRLHRVEYVFFGGSVVTSVGFGIAGLTAHSGDARLAGTLIAGTVLALSIGGLIVDALSTTPSDHLIAGDAPPGPNAF